MRPFRESAILFLESAIPTGLIVVGVALVGRFDDTATLVVGALLVGAGVAATIEICTRRR